MATTTTPAHPLRRLVVGIVLAVGALAIVLAIVALIALKTEWGARALWRSAAESAPGNLSGQIVGGTVDGGLVLRNVVYTNAGLRVAIDRLHLRWKLLRAPLEWRIFYARAGHIELTLPQGDDAPPTMPERLTLPLALRIDEASAQSLTWHRNGEAETLRQIRLHGRSDGRQHRLVLEQALSEHGSASGALSLDGLAPFPLQGQARFNAVYRAQAVKILATVSGTLAAPNVKLQAEGEAIDAQARLALAPFSEFPLRTLRLTVAHFNPKAINPDWPQADLSLRAQLAARTPRTDPQTLGGTIAISNGAPGPLNSEAIPLVSATAALQIGPGGARLSQLRAQVANDGTLSGQGSLDQNGQGSLALQVRQLDLQAFHSALRPSNLSGPVNLTLRQDATDVRLALEEANMALRADVNITPERVQVREASLSAGAARLTMEGSLGLDERRRFEAQAVLNRFDPAAFIARLAPERAAQPRLRASINARIQAQGQLQPELAGKLRFAIRESTYQGQPLTGAGALAIAGTRWRASDVRLSVAGNQLQLDGSLGSPRARMSFDINAPRLDALELGVQGRLRAEGELTGALERLAIQASVRASDLAFGSYRLEQLRGQINSVGLPGQAPGAPLELELSGSRLRSPELALETFSASIDGTQAQHSILLEARGRLRDAPLVLSAAASGALRQSRAGLLWNGQIARLLGQAAARIELEQPVALLVTGGAIELGSTRLRIARAQVALDKLVYNAQQIDSAGSFEALDVSHLLDLRRQLTGQDAPFSTNLLLDGQWQLRLADTGSGFVRVTRRSGDVRSAAGTPMGLERLFMHADLNGRRVDLRAQLQASRIGSASARGQLMLQQAQGRLAALPDSPISARIDVALPRLRSLAALAGPSVLLSGALTAEVNVNGTLGDPRFDGSVVGDDLAVTMFDYGLRLQDGTLRARLENQMLILDQAVFRGGEGRLTASGQVALDAAVDAPGIRLVAEQLQVLGGPTGTMTISGLANAFTRAGQFQIDGRFVVDRARFRLPDQRAPSLGADVVIVRDGQVQHQDALPWTAPAGRFAPLIELRLDLGDDFRFVGSGANLLLAGELYITAGPESPLGVAGTIDVLEGSYEAFGAELTIEQGSITFRGTPTNPQVNILAMRRGQEVDAGVRVTGTVERPRVQVVSEPEVPEAEKLSWLVFGRGEGGAPGQGGAAAAQAAGIGLLNRFGASRLASTVGLSELSIGTSAFAQDGEQVVNIGKEISDRLYVAYEQSLAGTGSILTLTYEISRIWSIVLHGGTVSGIEVRYDRRFDNFRSR